MAGQMFSARRLGALAPAAGHVFEQIFQLAVNTLSFTRVGAFALAHAGLSSAIVALAASAGHPLAAFLVMLLGNLIVLVLEGLVVSIQTTRLILFEFFIRFLTAQGRPFRPLPPPTSTFTERSPA
jgi:V/A-type H+-transporting ATPase subunit I